MIRSSLICFCFLSRIATPEPTPNPTEYPTPERKSFLLTLKLCHIEQYHNFVYLAMIRSSLISLCLLFRIATPNPTPEPTPQPTEEPVSD